MADPSTPAGEVLELLQALIRNECVNDGTIESGHEHRSVSTLAAYFGQPGDVFEAAPGRQSIVYRVPGRDESAPSLMLMGHLDVVPVTPQGWTVDPFAADVTGGYVWGRGAVDMLNLTAAMATVFRRYLTGERPQPAGDLLYLGVADEEAGGAHGAQWLLEHHPESVAVEYLLTEIAFPPIESGTGELVYPVKVGEKGPHWRRILARGTPSHGSQPYGTNNAFVRIARAVAALAEEPSPIEIVPEWARFVRGLELPPDQEQALLDPDRIDAEIDRLAVTSPVLARYVHACTHLTVSPNVGVAGTKMNTVADFAEAQIDIRALPGQDQTTVDDHFRKVLGPGYEEMEFIAEMDHAASSSPTQGPLWEAICDGIESMTGSRRVVPAMTPATTDARFFRARGTKAYGVGMFDELDEFSLFLSMFHGNDERVSVASLGATHVLLERIIERFFERAGD